MGWRYQVYVMAALFLQVNHYLRQFRNTNLVSMPQLANGIILAETTMQIAVGEENGARSSSSGDRRLFPMMGVEAGYNGQNPTAALAQFSRLPIHLTLLRAEHTAFQQFITALNPLSEFCLG
jgi:hypothetical protein